MQDFQIGNTRILVCADAAGMGVHVRDVARAVQWKIAGHLVLATLLQRDGRAGRDKNLAAVAIVFVDSKRFLQTIEYQKANTREEGHPAVNGRPQNRKWTAVCQKEDVQTKQ